MKKIYIHNWACISNLGFFSNISRGLVNSENKYFTFNEKKSLNVASIASGIIEKAKREVYKFEKLDRTTQIALFLAEKFKGYSKSSGISIGSSRAATTTFEKYHKAFLNSPEEKINPLASPLTTHGNVSSVVANYLNNDEGINIEHSVTCSSGFYSIIDAIAWINSGLIDNFIAGGVEAPLTAFTLAQMKALKIYSDSECYPFQNIKNTFVLGEGGALFNLSNEKKESEVYIAGFGTAHEKTKSFTSMSLNALHMQKAMKKAIGENQKPDVILAHAPGTLKGDMSELNAIKDVFSDNFPYVYSSKYIHGHTLGASGPISLALGIEILNTQQVPSFPYQNELGSQSAPHSINSILINTTGFGGNAVSLLIKRL